MAVRNKNEHYRQPRNTRAGFHKTALKSTDLGSEFSVVMTIAAKIDHLLLRALPSLEDVFTKII